MSDTPIYATCPVYHWGIVPAPVPDLRTHTLWCAACNREMDPKQKDPRTQGWREDHQTTVRITVDADVIGSK